MNYEIFGLFPTPVYSTERDSNLTPKEEEGVRKIIDEPERTISSGNTSSLNKNILNMSELKTIKQFCEEHIKIYVKEVIKPKDEIDCYITQSWLSITKPGEYHHTHCHPNSIVSGVFYIATIEEDSITFYNPNVFTYGIRIYPREYTEWNSHSWFIPVNNNKLILFPSWLEHQVEVNEKATTDRISLSFNTFVRGTLGDHEEATELILK